MKMKEEKKPRVVNNVVKIPTERIYPNPNQPRRHFDSEELKKLSESILSSGLLQPITVRKSGGKYLLISGERRLRAMRMANIAEADCIVIDTTERESAVLAMLENIQRCDLNYFEEAEALKSLMETWNVSQIELGVRLGKAQSTIANKIRLLRFNSVEREFMLSYNINERQARAMLPVAGTELLTKAVLSVAKGNMNTAQAEKYILGITSPPKPKKKFHPIIKDVRFFMNSINKAVAVMKQSGIKAYTEQNNSDDYIEYIVRIPMAQ